MTFLKKKNKKTDPRLKPRPDRNRIIGHVSSTVSIDRLMANTRSIDRFAVDYTKLRHKTRAVVGVRNAYTYPREIR